MIQCLVIMGVSTPIISKIIDKQDNVLHLSNPMALSATKDTVVLFPFPPLAKFGQDFIVNRSQIILAYEPNDILLKEYKKYSNPAAN